MDLLPTTVFDSGNGMQTHAWGPLLWTFLHIMSFNFPVKPSIRQRLHYWDFLTRLRHVLPCRHCRENMQRNLVDSGLALGIFESRETFSRFMYRFHNTVNKQLGKPEWDKSYEYLRANMECLRARCTNTKVAAAPKTEKGCTEPVVLGCPVASRIQIVKRPAAPEVCTALHFDFVNPLSRGIV